MFSGKVEVAENIMLCNDPDINNAATQGGAGPDKCKAFIEANKKYNARNKCAERSCRP